MPAPELVGRGGWIGLEKPLTIGALRGRIVVLHFLRFSSVGCLRVIEELRTLERLFAEEMVVVGVHSPGYVHETEHRAVRSAVARHRVDHAVLDDPDLATAGAYGVSSWPTVVVVDPAGQVQETLVGDGVMRRLERTLPALVERHDRDDSLQRGRVSVQREILQTPLAYPAKVAVSPDGRRLAIADPSHDQVLVCTLEGLVLEVHSGFSQPHGVRFDEDGDLALCDTGAGRVVRAGGEVVADAMSWPWDLVVDKLGMWVVAEAGHNRILRIKPSELRARVAAGTGAFGSNDGILAKAEMGQPSGVARTRDGIVFVDSEPGSLRSMGPEVVTTLVAEGLEHPRAVASDGGRLVYVADSFNSVIKVWEEGVLRTLPVEGLDEPGGLDVLPDGRLVVADTNNHRVVVADPVSGAVEPLKLDERWVHAAEGALLSASAGAWLEVSWAIELLGEEPEGARRSPVRVTVSASPPALLEDGPVSWSGGSVDGVVAARAGGPGSGMLLVEVTADVRHGPRRRLRRVNRFRYPFDVL